MNLVVVYDGNSLLVGYEVFILIFVLHRMSYVTFTGVAFNSLKRPAFCDDFTLRRYGKVNQVVELLVLFEVKFFRFNLLVNDRNCFVCLQSSHEFD